MADINNYKELYNKFTFHLIPVLNPEGYIIFTSAVENLIKKETSKLKIEKLAKEYYKNYRQDDINSKLDKFDKSIKLHQKMFSNATYNNISDEYSLLKKKNI